MPESTEYVLGRSDQAARRLEIQDRHFAVPSERLLDMVGLRPEDRVVELGCGPGGFTRRIVQRLGPKGTVVAVDSGTAMLEQAAKLLSDAGPGQHRLMQGDVSQLGPWLDGVDVVVGRSILHHVSLAEVLVGRLRSRLKPGTRIGFLEPDFRTPLAKLAYQEATGRPELAPLRVWVGAINDLYLARRISPDVGATLAAAMTGAGYANVRSEWFEFPSDELVIENIVMFYDEVRDTLVSYGILTHAEIDEQKRLLQSLPVGNLPGVWGVFLTAAVV